MSRRPTCASLIVGFLAAVKEAQAARIVRYMESDQLATPAETTRNRLWFLARAGRITRASYGRYRLRGEQ